MHAKQVADMLVTAGYSFASSSKKVVVVPMAYDYGEWDRGRQRLAAEIAMDHGAGSSTGRTVSHVADPASKKVRHRFLFCVLPQQAKLQHGLRTVLAVFPVVRKQVIIPPTLPPAHACMRTPMHAGIHTHFSVVRNQIPGASLVVVSTQRMPLPADLKREVQVLLTLPSGASAPPCWC